MHAFLPAFALVSANWALQVLDIVFGGRLQIDTAFGYSPIVAGRFQGFGNLAFALVAAAAVVVVTGIPALSRPWWPEDAAVGYVASRRLLVAAVAIFTLTFLVDGYPSFGSDVGGVLATVPAFALVVVLLGGWRVSIRKVVLIGLGTLVAISALAALDLSRPAKERTHLGRFVTDLFDGHAGVIMHRKLQSNWFIFTSSVWTWLVPVCLGFVAFLALKRHGYLHRLQRRVPGVRPCLLGTLVVGVLGFALNDSGVAVPAMMFGIVLPWITWLLLATEPAAAPRRQRPRGRGRGRGDDVARPVVSLPGAGAVKVLITFVLGAATAYGLWTVLQPLFAQPALQRKNHRGRELPTAAGLVIVLAPLPSIALWSVYDTIRDGYRPDLDRSWTTTVIVVVGFGLFGLLDDLRGDGGPRWLRWSRPAATRGELTTGLVKLVGGGLVAVAAAAPWADSSSHLVVGSLVIALAANLGNLFDRAPGRVEKVSILAFVVLAAGTMGAGVWPARRWSWAPARRCSSPTCGSAACSVTPARTCSGPPSVSVSSPAPAWRSTPPSPSCSSS